MVEVAAGTSKKSGGRSYGACVAYLVYFSILATVAVLALDGLEYISLGIVKDVLKMKVLTVEQFETTESDLATAKEKITELTTAKETAEKQVTDLTSERDGLKGQVSGLTNERDAAKKQVTDLAAERDGLKTKVDEVTKQVTDLTAERDSLKTKVEAAEAANAKDGEEKEE